MKLHRLAFTLASLALLSIPSMIACGHGGESPDPATAAGPSESASASASESAVANPGGAPNMDDTADDGSCAGANCVRRCDNKNRPLDCAAAGDALRAGSDGLTANVQKAVKYLEKACGLKAREACFHLGKLLVTGEGGVPADAARGIINLEEACDLGLGDACDDLARRAEAGEGMKKDHAKSIGYLASGCLAEVFEASSCQALVDAAGKKDKDAQRALEDWKNKCKATKDKATCAAVDRANKKK
jgi:TPR repeat protein